METDQREQEDINPRERLCVVRIVAWMLILEFLLFVVVVVGNRTHAEAVVDPTLDRCNNTLVVEHRVGRCGSQRWNPLIMSHRGRGGRGRHPDNSIGALASLPRDSVVEIDLRKSKDVPRTMTKTILRNVRVFAVGSQTERVMKMVPAVEFKPFRC